MLVVVWWSTAFPASRQPSCCELKAVFLFTSSEWAQVLLHSFLIFTEGVVRVLAGKRQIFLWNKDNHCDLLSLNTETKGSLAKKGVEQLTFEQVRLMNDDGMWRLLWMQQSAIYYLMVSHILCTNLWRSELQTLQRSEIVRQINISEWNFSWRPTKLLPILFKRKIVGTFCS